MTDKGDKQELQPIRTLRLKTPELDSPEPTNRERASRNYLVDQAKLAHLEQEPTGRSFPLSTILNRAQHAKRESLLHRIPQNLNDSLTHSQNSLSAQGSISRIEPKNENYSPKKSVFGDYSKQPEPFDCFPDDASRQDSPFQSHQKDPGDCFFNETSKYETTLFHRQTTEGLGGLPKLKGLSVPLEQFKKKRSSIDFINGVYPAQDNDEQLIKKLAQKELFPTNEVIKKKRIKKKKVRSKTKKTVPVKNSPEGLVHVRSEGSLGSEDGRNSGAPRKRYA